MAIETRLATRYWMRKLILSVLFLVFGLWAVYDGWWKWPAERDAWLEYQQFAQLEEKRQASPNETLYGDELQTWQALRSKYPTPPPERTQWDINFQRYLLVPLCFPITGLLLITWGMSARRKYVYREDGSLSAPEGHFGADQMTGMDMTRWMSKSIAMLEIEGGPKGGGQAVKLDAWIYEGMEEIIERLNRRFHPEEYQDDAPPGGAGAPVEGATSVAEREPAPTSAAAGATGSTALDGDDTDIEDRSA